MKILRTQTTQQFYFLKNRLKTSAFGTYLIKSDQIKVIFYEQSKLSLPGRTFAVLVKLGKQLEGCKLALLHFQKFLTPAKMNFPASVAGLLK